MYTPKASVRGDHSNFHSIKNASHIGGEYGDVDPLPKTSFLEKKLSMLGDISSRGMGGGAQTKFASPIAERRQLAEYK